MVAAWASRHRRFFCWQWLWRFKRAVCQMADMLFGYFFSSDGFLLLDVSSKACWRVRGWAVLMVFDLRLRSVIFGVVWCVGASRQQHVIWVGLFNAYFGYEYDLVLILKLESLQTESWLQSDNCSRSFFWWFGLSEMNRFEIYFMWLTWYVDSCLSLGKCCLTAFS